MPKVKPSDVKAKAGEIREKIAELDRRIETLPDGREKMICLLERESASILVEKAEASSTTDAEFSRHFARMYYLSQAENNNMSLDEVMEKTDALVQNAQYRRIFCNSGSVENNMNVLNSLFGGSRFEHVHHWVTDIENQTRLNYGEVFETLCKDLSGEERDNAKQRFIRMGAVNEAMREMDYGMAYTPEELYGFITDKELKAQHEAIVQTAGFVDKNTAAISVGQKKIHPTQPYPVDTPAFLARTFFYFLDYSGEETAAEKNQQTVNRLHSNLPEDREFQKEFSMNVANRMLAVPDEKLCPKNVEEAIDLLRTHFFEVSALMEAGRFADGLGATYHVPDNVVETIKHKADLCMQNVNKYISKIQMENTDAYTELAMLKGRNLDGDAVFTVGSNVKKQPMVQTAILGYVNAVTDLSEEKNDLPDAERYDGISLKKEDMTEDVSKRSDTPVQEGTLPVKPGQYSVPAEMMKAPEPPKPLGGWATFWHRFGFYKQEFDNYVYQMAEYEQKTEAYQEQLAAREQRRAESAKWRDDNANRMSAELDNTLPFREAAKQVRAHYKGILDEAFGEIEKKTGNTISRLDYVMVGSRTLRAVLQEEYINNHPGRKDLTASSNEPNLYCDECVKNGHVYDVLFAATLQNAPIRHLCVDAESGELKTDAKGNLAELTVAEPEMLKHLNRSSLADKSMHAIKASLKTPENATERMNLAQNCRAALRQSNFWHRVSMVETDNLYITKSFLGTWETKQGKPHTEMSNVNDLMITRSALQSLTIASLMCEFDMTPEQIFDPTYQPLIKSTVGEHIAGMACDPNCDCMYLGSLAVRGMQKMMDVIDARTRGRDMTDDGNIYSPSMRAVYVLATTAFDLHQEATRGEKMRTASCTEWASQKDMPFSTPEEQKNVADDIETLYDKIRIASSVADLIQNGRETGCRYCTGAVTKTGEGIGDIFAGEMVRQLVTPRLQAGKSLSECFTFEESGSTVRLISNYTRDEMPNATNQEEFLDLCDAQNVEDGVKFATYALSGELANDCKMEMPASTSEDVSAPTFVYTPSAMKDAPEMMSISVDPLSNGSPEMEVNLIV